MPAPMNPVPSEPPDPTERPASSPTLDSMAESGAARADFDPDGDSPHRSRGPRTVRPSRFGILIIATLVGSALFVGGFTLGSRVATTPGTPASQETRFDPFWDVYSLIQKDFAGSPRPTQDQLVQAAINGMMESLKDPWSYYQGPTDFSNSLLSVGGQAEGIGVQIQLQPVLAGSTATCSTIGNGCELAIVQPICGSPAASAGIQPGDVIVSVGGTSVDGLTIDQVTALIKGTNDTKVTLGLLRDTTTIQKSVLRTVYTQCEVTAKTYANGAVGYISVSGINGPASSQFDLALKNELAAGQRSFILDLRGNLGGYVPDAVKIASEFIPSGPIVFQQDASGAQVETAANPGGRATDPSIKLVVLVDGNTASAAEILAGALQARGRAPLIGTKTYGKGVVQEWLPLPNNYGGIHLTVARWLTPNEVWIQGKGLVPDIAATLDGARAGTDPVLDAGLVALGYPAQPAASASPAPSTSPAPSPSLNPSPSAS
jgi:carboxyl-terminal processing protease